MEATPKASSQVEVDRLRAAAAAELTHEEVKPIQSDFHFFAKENIDKYKQLAEEEVKKSLKEGEKLDPFLVNTNLNSRLLKAWEDLPKEKREQYMIKEEEDRRRFMEEDEIASRHCATLTARGKSPRTTEKTNDKGVKAETNETSAESDEKKADNEDPDPVKAEFSQNAAEETDAAMKEDESSTKRVLESSFNADADESDAKRTKPSDDQ